MKMEQSQANQPMLVLQPMVRLLNLEHLDQMMIVVMLLKYLQEEIDSIHRQSKPEKIKELLKELEKLKRERKQVQVSKEVVEKKYYQRLIDSEAFKRMMEDYEKRAINLGVEINDCEDDLKELKKP